jgi:proteic killer suppression protein
MILSFRDKDTERIWNQLRIRGLPLSVQRIGLRKLIMVHRARDLRDLQAPPGNRLEPLRGDLEGRYSIRINDRWRICFRWKGGNAYEVEIADYH